MQCVATPYRATDVDAASRTTNHTSRFQDGARVFALPFSGFVHCLALPTAASSLQGRLSKVSTPEMMHSISSVQGRHEPVTVLSVKSFSLWVR